MKSLKIEIVKIKAFCCDEFSIIVVCIVYATILCLKSSISKQN